MPSPDRPRPAKLPRSFSTRIALIFCVCMLPCAVLFLKARDYAHEQFEEHFRTDAAMSATVLKDSLLVRLVDIGAIGRFMEVAGDVTQAGFSTFVRPALAERGGVQAFEWVPVVPDEQRAAYEDRMRREWDAGYWMHQRLPDGSYLPAERRAATYPVQFIEPMAGKETVVGLDLGSYFNTLQALDKARDTGRLTATERVQVVKDRVARDGFLVVCPVYDIDRPMETTEDRRTALRGFALGVFQIDTMLGAIRHSIVKMSLAIEILDRTDSPAGQVLYNSAAAPEADPPTTFITWLESDEILEAVHDLEFAGRSWQLRLTARPGYYNENYPWTYWLILPIGVALSLLLSLFFAVMVRDKERLERRTAELGQVNEMLQGEIVDRRKAHRDTDMILKAVSAILIGVDKFGLVSKWNDSAEKAFRLSSDDVLGLEFVDMGLPWDWTVVREAIEKCSADLQPVQVNNLGYTRPSGKDGFLLATINPIIGPNPGGERAIEGFLLLADDITEFKLLEVQLSQSQKLESIGQLAAGIAHEINTPIQYVGDSVVFLKSAFEDCQRVLGLVEELTASGACALPEDGAGTAAGTGAGCAGGLEGIRAGLEEIDFEFFKEEVPKSFVRVLDGVERVSTIVQAMKRFSHPGGVERKAVDINKAIENTLVVSRNEWKYVAEVETELAPDLPQVVCMPSDLNQVLLNVVVNAAHAIAEVVRNTQDRGLIRIATRQADGLVEIAVRDSGGGIPAAIQDKVFDPFFTTKEVGRGTGQGLAIAYDIVVKKHGGRIFFESGEGRGTTFFVQLPVAA